MQKLQVLPVHIILGNSECRRITTTEPQRAGREWDPVATYTKLSKSIALPGKEINQHHQHAFHSNVKRRLQRILQTRRS